MWYRSAIAVFLLLFVRIANSHVIFSGILHPSTLFFLPLLERLLSQHIESLTHAFVFFGTGLNIRNPYLFGQYFSLSKGDHSFFLAIYLSAYQHFTTLIFCIFRDGHHPFLDVLKRLPISHRKSKQYSLYSSIVGLRDASESFLASSVPHLILDILILELYPFGLEVHPNGADVLRDE